MLSGPGSVLEAVGPRESEMRDSQSPHGEVVAAAEEISESLPSVAVE